MQQKISKKKSALYLLRYGLTSLLEFLLVFLVIYSIYWLCVSGYNTGYEIFGPVVVEQAPGEDKVFVVNQEESMWKIAQRLEEDGIIVNKYTFFVRTKMMDEDKTILRPGQYSLNTSMEYEEIIDRLTYSS